MRTQSLTLDQIQTAQHETERPFVARMYRNDSYAYSQSFATHALAWAACQEWNSKSPLFWSNITDESEKGNVKK